MHVPIRLNASGDLVPLDEQAGSLGPIDAWIARGDAIIVPAGDRDQDGLQRQLEPAGAPTTAIGGGKEGFELSTQRGCAGVAVARKRRQPLLGQEPPGSKH